MGNSVRRMLVFALVLAISGCVSNQSYRDAITRVEAEWKVINDQTLKEDGQRHYRATKEQGFTAAQASASELGMVVEEQSYETGFLFVTAPAPTPLTMSDWEKVQKEDTEELRSLISEEFGLLKNWVELDPSSKEVLANIFVTESDSGINVSIALRLRKTDTESGRKRRLQPPPTAVRLGLNKFWTVFEKELDATVAQSTTPAPQTTASAVAGQSTGAIEAAMPAAAAVVSHPDAIAVIIGNKNYGDRCPPVDFAHNDAEAMKRFFIGTLGVSQSNIIDMRDVKLADMEAVFGNWRTYKAQLWRYVRPHESDVYIFYSGHGVPSLKDGREYLLPVEADPDSPEIYGFAVELLYKNLAQLEASSVTVFIDACFSGQSPQGMLIRNVSGIRVAPKKVPAIPFTVMTAARDDQMASWDNQAQLSLFTKHLLDALYGAADSQRYGNVDSQITVNEIKNYLDREMTYAARRQYGREQQAMIYGDPDKVIVVLKKK